jgi:hypothetical protein
LSGQGELAPTFRAFGHSALHKGRTASAGEGSPVGHVEGEAAARAAKDVLSLSHGSFCLIVKNRRVCLKMLLE